MKDLRTMTKLADMKRPKPKKETGDKCVTAAYYEPYPYGLRLNLEKDEIKNLNIKVSDYKIGDTVYVFGQGKIVSISENASENGSGKISESQSMSVQIIKMQFTTKDGE